MKPRHLGPEWQSKRHKDPTWGGFVRSAVDVYPRTRLERDVYGSVERVVDRPLFVAILVGVPL